MTYFCNYTPAGIRVNNDARTLGYYWFLQEPYCIKCGSPGIKTEDCMLRSWVYGFNRVYALGKYISLERAKDLLSKHIVWLKMGYREYSIPLGSALSLYVKNKFPELLNADFIVPVPAHPNKKNEKKDFNHSELITKEYCMNTNHEYLICLEQVKNTKFAGSSYGLVERYKEVKGMFKFLSFYDDVVSGKHIILLDDIATTCAQSSECSQILLNHGAKKVDVLILGRNELDDSI